jgi:hypothetical protein
MALISGKDSREFLPPPKQFIMSKALWMDWMTRTGFFMADSLLHAMLLFAQNRGLFAAISP